MEALTQSDIVTRPQLSLGELCALIGEALDDALQPSYWVRAEISSLSVKGGHMYLELVESRTNKDNGYNAKMRATCWSGTRELLMAYFESETGRPLSPGMDVLVEVEVQWHAVYGLSLSIVGIDPSFTLGGIAAERQRTIARLQADGLMDAQQLLPLPALMRRIAVISSPSAAGYGDFIHQLHLSPYAFETTLFGAVMQGEGAERSILAALEEIANSEAQTTSNSEAPNYYDAVVIIRGGGATADLSCFDSYTLCAVCAQYELPVLTGIGHTRDVSVLDMIAREPLKTPTAVADYLIHRMDLQAQRIDTLFSRLERTAERQRLVRLHRIELLQQRLAACNPEHIYRRGYALVTAQGKIIRSLADIHEGQHLTIHLADGSLHAIAEK